MRVPFGYLHDQILYATLIYEFSMISHKSVLKNEVLAYLDPKPGNWIIDATLGFGGHAKAILEKLGTDGLLIGIDQDGESLEIAKQNLKDYPNTLLYQRNFEDIESVMRSARRLRGAKKISGILFDLGMSSLHVETPERGFSFLREGALDMRFDTRTLLTAHQIINQWSYEKLLYLFKTFGEEPHPRAERIVRAILDHRRKSPIRTTRELSNLIASVFPQKVRAKHPATRIFQALRIAVNRELEVLQKGLSVALKLVSRGSRIVVISFHSLEDRLVKNMFREYSEREKPPKISILTKKPVIPSDEEIRENPRARSAKLRAVERIL